jgi:hypothetical protein
VIYQPTSDGTGKAVRSRHCPRNCKRPKNSARFKPLFDLKREGAEGKGKDEGRKVKDESKAMLIE